MQEQQSPGIHRRESIVDGPSREGLRNVVFGRKLVEQSVTFTLDGERFGPYSGQPFNVVITGVTRLDDVNGEEWSFTGHALSDWATTVTGEYSTLTRRGWLTRT